MKNKYAGKCCVCGQPVGPFEGELEPRGANIVVKHTDCKVKNVAKPREK